jgi:integrase/recombinase XerD
MRRSGCTRAAIQEFRGDPRKKAIDLYDHWTMEELKETYMKYISKFEL